ncbi:MAG: alpha/beta hydrolase [Planctomycetaceae bacterium]
MTIRIHLAFVFLCVVAAPVNGQQAAAVSESSAESVVEEPLISWSYPPEMPGATVETYRTVGDTELKAWIFQPKDHQPTERRPAIVFFFGGGWNAGTPGQFLPQCRHLAERGMVAVSVDYRVKSRQGVFPQDCVRDAKAAVRWLRASADRLGIDPHRIAAGGGSAGGHLAAATALVPGFEDGDHTDVSSMPDALVLFNPAVALAPIEGAENLFPPDKAASIRERADGRPEEISPIGFVRSGLPPTIIFHGTNDEAVPFASVELFRDRMTAAGNRCELKAYEGRPHGFFNPGRGQGQQRAAATQDYYRTLRELDMFLESLGYLQAAGER